MAVNPNAAQSTAETAQKTVETAQKTIEAGVESATKVFEDNAERVQDFNDKFVAIAKQASLLGLDSYEKSLSTVIDFQKKVASASGLEWLGAAVEAQTGLVAGLSANATAAVREVIK